MLLVSCAADNMESRWKAGVVRADWGQNTSTTFAGIRTDLHISADEIEAAVLERIKSFASSDKILCQLTEETNKRLLKQKPSLEKQKQGLLKSLAEVKNQANNS